MEKPKGYSKDRINEIKDSVEITDEDNKPNIIFVMNESLYDVMQVDGLSVSADPLAKVKEWQREYTSGYFVSPQIGGGTCNVEFEVLTGCSVENTGGSTVMPYVNMIGKDIDTLVSLMNSNGYDTAAFHPNMGSFLIGRLYMKIWDFKTHILWEKWEFFRRKEIIIAIWNYTKK